ncbi:MAG TPA: ATP synthase subunit C [Anaerolineae bacterium]|nr:ATP synthase subunit C [Anaerolineae bacterium]
MTLIFVALIAGLLPLIPGLIFTAKNHKSPVQFTRNLTVGLKSINLALALATVGLGLVLFFAPGLALASGLPQAEAADPYASIAAAIAVGVGSISAGFAVSSTGAAAIGAIAEKPDVFGRALIFVGLSEGVAIYGLIIAFIILNR